MYIHPVARSLRERENSSKLLTLYDNSKISGREKISAVIQQSKEVLFSPTGHVGVTSYNQTFQLYTADHTAQLFVIYVLGLSLPDVR